MDAYYINLDTALKRKRLIETQKEMSALDFEIKRFSAVRGTDHVATKPYGLSDGQWGCWLSHLQIIQKSLLNDDHLLIIEDDEYFNENLKKVDLMLNNTPSNDWDIIYLDATFVEVLDYIKISQTFEKIIGDENIFMNIEKNFTVYGTHAYILNKRNKIKIFEILKNNSKLGIPIDNVFCAAIKQGLIKAKIILPLLMSPGAETATSQIADGCHPLSNDWEEFRNLISSNPFNALEISTKKKRIVELINNRNNFSLTGEFTPYEKNLIT